MKSLAFIALVFLLGSPCAMAVAPAASSTRVQMATSEPINSPTTLERYLRATPPGVSPLDLLSAGARTRFIASLRFGAHSLGGFDPRELTSELTDAEIVQVLQLFGAQRYATSLHGVSASARARRQQRCPTVSACPQSAIEQRYTRLFVASEAQGPQASDAQIGALYQASFARGYAPHALRAASDSDLRFLYRAADLVPAGAAQASVLRDQTQALAELQRRSLATAHDAQSLQRRFIATRDFAAADKLTAQFPAAGLNTVPPFHDLTPGHYVGPSTLAFDAASSELLRQRHDMHAPAQIVVVAGCHFAADAARDIDADPQLKRVFQHHALWLSPQSESLEDVRQWNRDHPAQPMNIAWHDREWSALDSWDMPTFYFFRNGQLVAKFSGWGQGGPRQLRAALRQSGLLD